MYSLEVFAQENEIDEIVYLHSHDSKRLEQQGQSRSATGKTRVQKADTRDDEPYKEGHDHEIDVVKLQSLVLSIDIFKIGVAAIRLCLVELWLYALLISLMGSEDKKKKK